MADDRLRDNIARSKLGPRVVFRHEPRAVFIHEPAALAAHGFSNQAAAAARDVQDRRMELDEFHVTKLGARPVRHGVAVTGRDGRIGRFAIDLSAAARGQNCLPGPNQHLLIVACGDDCAAAGAFVRQQI